MRVRIPGLAALGLAQVLAFALVGVVSSEPEADSAPAVRRAREVFNQAIARKDAAGIGALLAPTYHIVTGRSDQFHGSAEETKNWADRFRSDPTMTYRRTPREVTVNEAWGLAQEVGDWSGRYTVSEGSAAASGVYAAKWQRAVDGRWLLQAEVFTTLKCEGPAAGCPGPQPVP